jgi:hypothetical protein
MGQSEGKVNGQVIKQDVKDKGKIDGKGEEEKIDGSREEIDGSRNDKKSRHGKGIKQDGKDDDKTTIRARRRS